VKRLQLEAMQSFGRDGDTVFCQSMDRLARNLDDLRRIVLGLTKRGVHIVFVKEHLTFTGEDSPMSNLLLSVMGARERIDPRGPARGDRDCKKSREVHRQKAIVVTNSRGRVAAARCRWAARRVGSIRKLVASKKSL
jgi:DNA invertase Pin-like site-specific DNA recombinase